jgi:hypothetical protein
MIRCLIAPEKNRGCQQFVNQQPHNPRGNRCTLATPRLYTTYTGTNMTLQAGMRFEYEDWAKLEAYQKTKMKEFQNQRQCQTTVHLNNASTSTTPPVATSPRTSEFPDICNLLPNSTSRDPNPSQLVFNGRTYS